MQLIRLAVVSTFLFLGATGVVAEVIDRVLAVVEGQIITLSDVRGAVAVGLVNMEKAEDPIAAALDQLIERELVMTEVERYQPPEPSPEQVAARVEAITRRFPSPAAFTAALEASGFTEERLADTVRNDLRTERYLEQRFAATAQPTDEEVISFFRDHASEFAVDGRVPAIEQVREQVRRRLASERHAALVADWIDGLKRRADIIRLYLPNERTSHGE